MKKIEFTIPGQPKGWGRPGFNRRTGAVFTQEGTLEYERAVKAAYLATTNYYADEDQPMAVLVTAFYKIPKSDTKAVRERKLRNWTKPVIKPDADNILKIILDGLNDVAWADDKQVVDVQCRKRYSTEPRVEVTIMEVCD